MCMFVFWENMSGCFRAIFGCLIFLIFAGPVLIILGIVLLASENQRESDVLTYNNQVAVYNRYSAPLLARTTGSVETTPFTALTGQIPVQGALDGVTLSTHTVLQAVDVPRSLSDYYNVTFSIATNATSSGSTQSSLELYLPWSAVTTTTLYCTVASCTNNCASADYSCSRSTMRTLCQSAYVGSYTTGNSVDCRPGEACGTCTYSGQLTSACVVVNFDDEVATRSDTYTSCYYPFTSFRYDSVISMSFTLVIMAEDDPWLTLESLTEGSDDFGATADQQHASGVALLVVGLLITGVVGVLLYCIIQRHTAQGEQQPPQAPQAAQPMYAAGYAQQQHPQYAQQQQPMPACADPQLAPAVHQQPPALYSPQTAEAHHPAPPLPPPPQQGAFATPPTAGGHEPHPDGGYTRGAPAMAV